MPPKILIVEDSIVSATMMEVTINRKKPEFEVRMRRSLKGAFEEMERFSPNIVILDPTLPDSLDGSAAIAAIPEIRKRACVIVVSGFHDLKEAALAAGANDFMGKSIGDDAQSFIDRVTALLPRC